MTDLTEISEALRESFTPRGIFHHKFCENERQYSVSADEQHIVEDQ
jgi:hypothetical protein